MKKYLTFLLVFTLLYMDTGHAAADERNAVDTEKSQESAIAFRIYVAQKGDTLSSIAGQMRIYNNPSKWPLIYFFNREDLREFKVPPAELPETPLSPGTALAIVRSAEAEKRAVRQADAKPWVANIISSTEEKDLVPLAVRLIDSGYFAYISEWNFREKHWKRLRIGFFKDRDTAVVAARKILDEMGMPNCWVLRAEWSELIEFGGFAD